jgi:hypothetical protein
MLLVSVFGKCTNKITSISNMQLLKHLKKHAPEKRMEDIIVYIKKDEIITNPDLA